MTTLATAAVATMNPAVAVTMAATVRGGDHDKRNSAAIVAMALLNSGVTLMTAAAFIC